MRADGGALEALDAALGLPLGDVDGDVALLVLRGRRGPSAVVGDGGDGKLVAFLAHHLGGNVLDEVGRVVADGGGLHELTARSGRHGDLLDGTLRGVNGVPVQLHHVIALLAVCLLGGCLEKLDSLGGGDDAGDDEECSLHDGVGAPAKPESLGDLHGVDHVELQLLLYDDLGDLVGDVIPHALGVVFRL